MQAYFYSVIIAEANDATWAGSNIFLQPKQAPPLLPAAPDGKKSKLN